MPDLKYYKRYNRMGFVAESRRYEASIWKSVVVNDVKSESYDSNRFYSIGYWLEHSWDGPLLREFLRGWRESYNRSNPKHRLSKMTDYKSEGDRYEFESMNNPVFRNMGYLDEIVDGKLYRPENPWDEY